MKLGDYIYTPENAEVLGGEGLAADQMPGQENAEPNDPKINELTMNTEVDEAAAKDEAETQVTDFNRSLKESSKVTNDLDNAASLLDDLQDTGNALIKEKGALTPVAAEIMATSLESIYKNLDIPRPVMPSMETFGGTWSKKDASRLTMEAIAEAKPGIIGSLIERVAAMAKYVANFFKGLMMNHGILIKALKKKEDRLLDVKNNSSMKSDHLTGRHVSAFQFGTAVSYETVNRVLSTASASVDYYDYVNAAIQSIRDSRDPDKDLGKLDTIVGRVASTEIDINGKRETIYGAYPNGKSLYLKLGEDYRSRVSFATNIPDGGERIDTMKALTPSECGVIVRLALRTMESFSKVENRFKTLSNAIDGILRSIKGEWNRLRSAMGSESHTKEVELRARVTALQSYLSELVGRLPSQIYSACNHADSLVRQAIDNFSKN